jgi:hypothetical protein
MAEEREQKDRGFTVVDKRSSSAEQPEKAGSDAGDASGAGSIPAMDFSTFTLSLGTSALYHMGLVEDQETGAKSEPNLVLARQTIDTLVMLQSKTTGNLEGEEARLLETLLYELRMRFVDVSS